MNTPTDNPAFLRAVDTARYYMFVIDPKVTKPEYLDDYVITRDDLGSFRVYQESAWTPQSESILPWGKPDGHPIAKISRTDGAINILEGN